MSYRFILTIWLGGILSAQTPGAQELIEKHLRAVGDPQARGQVRSLVRTGVVRQGGAEYPAELQNVAPDNFETCFRTDSIPRWGGAMRRGARWAGLSGRFVRWATPAGHSRKSQVVQSVALAGGRATL